MEEISLSRLFSITPSAADGHENISPDSDTNNATVLWQTPSPPPEVVSVALWPVIIHFLLLITVVCLGIPTNAVVLMAARWPSRPRHVWRRLVIGNLCVTQLLVCIIVSPVGLVTTLAGYQQRPLPAGLCTAATALLHAVLAASVVGFCLLAALRWHNLSLVCGGEQPTDEPSGRSLVATACIAAAPWAAGAVAAALSAVGFPSSVAFSVCRQLTVSQEMTGAAWRMKNILVLVDVLATAACVVVLGAVYRYHSDRLARLFAGRSEQTILLGGNNADDSNRKRRSSRGQDSVHSGKRSVDEGKRPTNLTVLDGRPNEGVVEEEDENEGKGEAAVEDTLDTKMRLKFQKKNAKSSGRRHTVANICLPDFGNHRRRSLENGGKGKTATSPSAPNDYQYVRKWSVDITALANQLENPKIHTGSYPTLRNSSPSSSMAGACLGPGYRVGGGPARSVTPEIDSAEASSKDLSVLPYTGGASSPSSGLPPPLSRLVEKKRMNAEMCITLETPSIVVSLTPDTEAGDEDDDANTMADSFVSQSKLESDGTVTSSPQPASSPVAAAISMKMRIVPAADDKGVLTAREELSEVLRTTVALLVSLLLMLPLAVFSQAERVVGTGYGLGAAFNLDLVCAALCLLQAATIPGLQVWANRDLKDQLILIAALLRSLRCICYCNLGTGRSCLVRKRRREKRRQKV